MLQGAKGSSETVLYPRVENIELGIVNLAYSTERDGENGNPTAGTSRDVADNLPQPGCSRAIGPPPQPTSSSATAPKHEEPPDEGGTGGGREPEHGQINSREKWDNQIEFLLSCVSMSENKSVGLGNVWRFPFTAYENGGGAFLVPYMIVLCVFGRPMYFLEMCLGQFSSFGPVKIWEISPIFRGVGYASTLAACCTASFYCSIMAITIYYFYLSFSNPLPWSVEVCNATETTSKNSSADICERRQDANQSFSELYYYSTVFPQQENIDAGIGLPHWRLAVCLLISWVVIYGFLMKGIKSMGKVSFFTALFPYAVLIALLIRGVTLPGALDGIYYFIEPDWKKLLDAKVWFAAVSQCFFSLNVGFGTIVFLSSHNQFRHNVFRDAIVISITDTFTSCLAGVAIFSLLGYLANTMNTNIEQVTRGGPGLAFIAFPESIAHLKFFPQGFAVLFFLMLFTLGVGSAMALSGQVVTVIRDQYPTSAKWKVALVVCTLGFASGIVYITPGGQFILTLVNHNGVDFIIYITAMIEIIAVSWVYGVNRFCDDIKFMLGRETQMYWKICWAFIMPVGLFILLVYFFATYKSLLHEGTQFPTSALVGGWILSGLILSTLPICAIRAVFQSRGNTWMEKLKAALKPLPSWGPKSHSERHAWLLERGELREIDRIKASANTDQLSVASTAPQMSTSGSSDDN